MAKKKSLEYNHYLCRKNDGTPFYLLGVNKHNKETCREEEISETDLFEQIYLPTTSEEFWMQYNFLSAKNQQIIKSIILKIQSISKSYDEDLNTFYWKAVIDFVLAYRGVSLYSYSHEEVKKEKNSAYDESLDLYNCLRRSQNVTDAKHRKVSQTMIAFCMINLIEPSILSTGRGKMYAIAETVWENDFDKTCLDNYTLKKVEEELTKEPKLTTKEMILRLTGLNEDALESIDLEIKDELDEKTISLLLLVMKELEV